MKNLSLLLTAAIVMFSCKKDVINNYEPTLNSNNKSEVVTAVDTIKNQNEFLRFWSASKKLAEEDVYLAAARRQAVLIFEDGSKLTLDHSENHYNKVYLSDQSFGLQLSLSWKGNKAFCGTTSWSALYWTIMDVKSGPNTLLLHNIDTDKKAVVYWSSPIKSPCGSVLTEVDFKKFPRD